MSETGPYRIEITQRAQEDIAGLTPKLRAKLRDLLVHRIAADPDSGKKLVGDLKVYWSGRLTYKDRVVCRSDEEQRFVYVLRARTHYTV